MSLQVIEDGHHKLEMKEFTHYHIIDKSFQLKYNGMTKKMNKTNRTYWFMIFHCISIQQLKLNAK